MSFKAAKTHKRLITAFKSGNMFKQPASSRILSKKPTYFINKPKIAISAEFANKIRVKSNKLVCWSRKRINKPNRMISTWVHGADHNANYVRFYSQQNFAKNGITIGDKFIPIEDPQKLAIEIQVHADKTKLVWDENRGRYYLYDLNLDGFMPRLEIEKMRFGDRMFHGKTTLEIILTFIFYIAGLVVFATIVCPFLFILLVMIIGG